MRGRLGERRHERYRRRSAADHDDALAVVVDVVIPVLRVNDLSAEALGTRPREMLLRVFLPHALPDIFTGLRVALGFSFVLAISSEMIAATNGIGKLIFMYGENGAYDYMFAAIASIVVVAFLADRALLWIGARCLRWHESAAGEAA